jgi:hypothetical protein
MTDSTGTVCVLANDPFVRYFVAFLESFREHNPQLSLAVIPFDERIDLVRRLASIYGYRIVDDDFTDIDNLSSLYFPLMDPWYVYLRHRLLRNRLRKLFAFSAGGERFMYIDVDCIITRPIASLFGALDPARADIVALQRIEPQYVFKPAAERCDWYPRAPLFPTSFFISHRAALSLAEIAETLRSARDEYLQTRDDRLFDQPLLNFVCAKRGLRVATLKECGVNAEAAHVGFGDLPTYRNGVLEWEGHPNVFMCHWPGHRKETDDFDANDAWQAYFRRGIETIGTFDPDLARRIEGQRYQGFNHMLDRARRQ